MFHSEYGQDFGTMPVNQTHPQSAPRLTQIQVVKLERLVAESVAYLKQLQEPAPHTRVTQ